MIILQPVVQSFENNTFDAVSCRLDFMFFVDMMLAFKEMVLGLKPGGRIATSVWDIPEKNFWFTGIISSITKHLNVPAPDSNAPGMFRCAKEKLMLNLFAQAGLKNISVTEVEAKLHCKTTDVYWTLMNELAVLKWKKF